MRFRREDLRVETFEYVEVGADLALLRLAGEWRGDVPHAVALIAGHGGEEQELAALPEPPDDGAGLWRAAFSAGTELLGGRATFTLETGDGRVVRLPQPQPHHVVAPAAAVAEPEPLPVEPLPPAPEPAYAESLPAEPERAPLPDTAALEAERARHERVEAALREQLRVMVSETAEFMGRLEGYETRRAELEKELSWERLLHKETRRLKDEAERERDDALRGLAPVKADLERARTEVEAGARASRRLVEARERVEELERRLEQQDEMLRGAREVLGAGATRLAELEERLVALREEIIGLPPESAHELEQVLDDAERGTERLAHLERRMGELREEIAGRTE